jgi:hypothetical protein
MSDFEVKTKESTIRIARRGILFRKIFGGQLTAATPIHKTENLPKETSLIMGELVSALREVEVLVDRMVDSINGTETGKVGTPIPVGVRATGTQKEEKAVPAKEDTVLAQLEKKREKVFVSLSDQSQDQGKILALEARLRQLDRDIHKEKCKNADGKRIAELNQLRAIERKTRLEQQQKAQEHRDMLNRIRLNQAMSLHVSQFPIVMKAEESPQPTAPVLTTAAFAATTTVSSTTLAAMTATNPSLTLLQPTTTNPNLTLLQPDLKQKDPILE